MFKYKDLQILKHAMQHYIQRSNANSSDIEEEKRLLDKIINEVEQLKDKYKIS